MSDSAGWPEVGYLRESGSDSDGPDQVALDGEGGKTDGRRRVVVLGMNLTDSRFRGEEVGLTGPGRPGAVSAV